MCRRYRADMGIFMKSDVTIGTEVEALVQTAVETGGRLDV